MNAWELGFLEGLRPTKPLSVSEWQDKHRVLSSKSSSEPGRMRTDRTPYMKQPADDLSGKKYQKIVLMFSSQSGKTELMNSFLGWIIDHSPAPALIVNATLEMSKRLSKQRLDPMISETPCLREKIAPPRKRDSGNTIMSKDFPNGFFILTGSNSATGLRSTPCKYVLMDEVDSFVSDVDGEGDPVELAIKRATTFPDRKILLTSTPTIKDFSRIEKEYLKSNMNIYEIPCPLCGAYQELVWPNLIFDEKNLEKVEYKCISCEQKFDETYKTQFLREGKWKSQQKGDGITAGYRLSGLYSPLGWLSWRNLAEEFIAAKGDYPLMKTFTNTRLSETFELDYVNKMSVEGLLKRCEGYEEGSCPEGVLCITQGVDCQIDRLEISTWGWGAGEESWLIEHHVINGDPHQKYVWEQLDFFINREYEHKSGNTIKPAITAIDSGGLHTSEVYQYARERQAQGVIAIKGQSQRNKPPISRPSRVDINLKGRSLSKGAKVYPVGVDTIKTLLMGRLKNNKKNSTGYIHFHSTTSEEYFKQITAEKQQIKKNKSGFQIAEWILPSGQRNECLDVWVYSYAALYLYLGRFDRKTVWDTLEKRIVNKDNVRNHKDATIANKPTQSNYVNSW